MRMGSLWLVGLLVAAGCTGSESAGADAGLEPFVGELCPGGQMPEGATLAGEVEVGTGVDFEPIADEGDLTLIRPVGQGSTMFMIHPRIRGLEPGEPGNNNSPLNPATVFTAFSEDGVKISAAECIAATLPYRQRESTPEDAYDLGFQRRLEVREDFSAGLHGQRVRIVVEVLDHWGRYAVGEVWVRANADG